MFAGRDLYGEYSSCINCGYCADVYVGPPIELKEAWQGSTATKNRKVRRCR